MEVATRWAEVATQASSIQALRLSDPLGPTKNARRKFLTVLMQALTDQIDTLIREMLKGLTATTYEHRQKEGNLPLKELLEHRVATARTTSTNSVGQISMKSFIQVLGNLLV